ncbi:MAG: hypothetical protein FWG42_08340 [Clostridiales bacterium]|nr:hypothetical protein [Clostridiales bacterium]
MMKKIYISIIAILLLVNIFQFSWNQFAYNLSTDAVQTEEVALEVGKAIIVGTFGVAALEREFLVGENNNSWIVAAPLPDGLGWSYEVIIRKHDGKILYIRAV